MCSFVFLFFVMLMCFIHATVAVTWETIRMCASVSDDNVCVPTHCPSCIDLKASWSFLLSVPILAVFSFSFFSNLYRQQQVSCIMAEQVARKWKGDSPLWPQTSLQINKLQRDNYARGQQVFQELKSADIFGLNGKKNLCPRQRRSGEGDQRHLATDISFIIKPGLAAVKVQKVQNLIICQLEAVKSRFSGKDEGICLKKKTQFWSSEI